MNEQRSRQLSIALPYVIIGVFLGGVILLLMLPVATSNREIARPSASKNNLKQIGLALHNYHDTHNMLPPGKTVTATGDDYHGWPAMLLPFIDQSPLYNQLDFNQWYLHPDNLALMRSDLQVFENPMLNDRPQPPSVMHYTLNSHVFQTNKGFKFSEITDGTSNTMMGGTINDGFRPWYEPNHTRDPALGLNKGPLTFGDPYYGTKKEGTTQILLMDGAVRSISNDIDPAILKALATPAGGEDMTGMDW